jgi:hypothetical protein
MPSIAANRSSTAPSRLVRRFSAATRLLPPATPGRTVTSKAQPDCGSDHQKGTTVYAPPVQSPPSPSQSPKKRHTARKVILICLGALVVLIVLIASLAGGGKSTPKAASPAVTHSTIPVKLSAAQLAAQRAAATRAAAAAKAAAAKAAAAARVAAAQASASAKAAAVQASASAKAAAVQASASAKAAAVQASASASAKAAAENTPISATQWGDVLRNPTAYVGDIYTITGTVAEYNINSNTFATVADAALVAVDSNGNQFIVEGDASLLGNAQTGDNFTAKVKVVGVAQTQSTTGGGTGQAPDFDALTFTDTGSGS